jgi:hypothetical protein
MAASYYARETGTQTSGRGTAKRRVQGRHSHCSNASKVTSEFSFLGFFFLLGFRFVFSAFLVQLATLNAYLINGKLN